MKENKNNYVDSLGWKKPILFIGFLGVFNIVYWILQFVSYQTNTENRFFGERFYKITYIFGWFYLFVFLSLICILFFFN